MTLDIADYKTESWTVAKGIQDALWVLSTRIDKHDVPAFFEMIQATAQDHNDLTHTPFVGIIPATDYTLAAAADKAALTGYDYGWYLTVQYVPSDDRTTGEDTNPSDTITTLLGGTAWATVTGIEPYRINTVTDWTNIKKTFEFGDRCTRWKAIQEICDYCNFVFVVKWRDVSGTWRPCAYFVHEDDIDSNTTGLDIPAAVTITDPDAHLMSGVSVKYSPEHQYNRVLANGYDATTDTHYYATAQTAGVSAGTEIPIEYILADASLNTQDLTDTKAQELLDFFQASAKVYVARFNRRMDLELYQKISFVGYNKIDTDPMRITRISYTRSAANDVTEIKFSKDQAIQQLRRLDRAVNPDYVSGAQDMINIDLSDIGLIDAFNTPLTPLTLPLWGEYGASVQLVTPKPVSLQGESLTRTRYIGGSLGEDISLWGSNAAGSCYIEAMRWNQSNEEALVSQYIEILEDIYIHNDGWYPKIYFDIDYFRPTYIQAGVGGSFVQELSMYVGGDEMMRFMNYLSSTRTDKIGVYATMELNEDLVIAPGNAIKGEGNLVFWDNKTGQKTLSELAAGGGDGLTNPATAHLDMNGYDIEDCDDIDCDDIDCDDIDCDDIDCDDISADNIHCDDIECEIIDCTNHGIYNISHLDFWAHEHDDPPSNKTAGTLWYDGDNAVFKYWTGLSWKTITATV